jgi:hypothetical protein
MARPKSKEEIQAIKYTFRMKPSIFKILEDLAEKNNTTKSKILSQLIEEKAG